MNAKNCIYCGKPLEITSRSHNKRYCNETCRNGYRRHGSQNSSFTNEDLTKEVEINIEKVDTLDLLEEVSKRGFQSVKKDVRINRTYKFPRKLKPFKLGIVSDTHLGSIHQQITLLHEAYKTFQQEGITKVLHIGDMTEGNGKLFKGQVFEMFLHGADSMVNYTIKNYPHFPQITTYIIAGSHDYSFFKEEGTDVLARIAEKRSDIKYLGVSGAYVKFGKISIYLMHPSGGTPYARSYRMQKTIEQFPPADKPNILLVGHLHITNELPCYRNVAGFQVPCFQTQTQYLRAKGLAPDIGFLILEIFPDMRGLSHYKSDWHIDYVPVEGDY